MAQAAWPLVERRFGRTNRRDLWWVQPLVTFLGLSAFIVYATWAAFQGNHYEFGPYLSPFYSPLLSDWRNFENWRLAGALDTAQRANQIWKQALADFAAPALDPAIDEALRDFVARRKEAGGVKAA